VRLEAAETEQVTSAKTVGSRKVGGFCDGLKRKGGDGWQHDRALVL